MINDDLHYRYCFLSPRLKFLCAMAVEATRLIMEDCNKEPDIRFLAGGTTLIDLMKLEVETPGRLLDNNRLPFNKIEDLPNGGLKIGATVRNSDLAHHTKVKKIMPYFRRRFCPGHQHSFQTWRPLQATFFKERVACTSATLPCRVTSASPERAAQQSPAATVCSRFSEPVNIALRPIHRTCA
jgi:hypothetical protein